MLLDWVIHTWLIQKILSHGYQSKHHMRFYNFSVTQDYYSCVSVKFDLVCSTSWVGNIGDLVLTLTFYS